MRRFAPRTRTESEKLPVRFHQAVVEVYTLKQAGIQEKNIATHAYSGRYGGHRDAFNAVQISVDSSGHPVLKYPDPEAQARLLEMIQKQPEIEAEEVEDLLDEAEELSEGLIKEPTDVQQEVVPKEKEVPAAKAGPLIKQTEGKPFDFMSNRPVPRAKPEEVTVLNGKDSPTPEIVQAVIEADIASTTESIDKEVVSMHQKRPTIPAAAVQNSEQAIAAVRKDVRGNLESLPSQSIKVNEPKTNTKYGQIKLESPHIKFAVSH